MEKNHISSVRTSLEKEDNIHFQDLELHLQNELSSQLSDLEFLHKDRKKIGNPESLGLTVVHIVWEQFCNQMANTAGEDFIRENGNLTLDLRSDAHIQTTENFEKGNVASHNKTIDYQKRYNDWDNSFKKDNEGNTATKYDKRSNQEKAITTKEARKPFDADREIGSSSIHKDHTIAAAEIIRDAEANCHLHQDEKVNFANSDVNLRDLDSSANSSKGDSTMSDWLDSDRNGEKPAERYDIDEKKCRQDDKVAREKYESLKKEGENRSVETGKQSQKEEAVRISKTALKAVLMRLLADLAKEVIRELIKWLKVVKKDLESLISSVKTAIENFITNIKTHLVNAGTSLLNTIATSILGPIMRTLSKAFTLIKQGFNSIKEAIAYIKNPENSSKPAGVLILEVGKIIVAGLSAAGALILSEAIEKGLMAFPVFAIEIPLLGSLASILGLFLGGLISGVIGAIAINIINTVIEKSLLANSLSNEMDKSNQILNTQEAIISFKETKLNFSKVTSFNNIHERHRSTLNVLHGAMTKINSNNRIIDKGKVIKTGNEGDFDDLLSIE